MKIKWNYVLVTTILLLVEYIIFNLSYRQGSNQELLGQVSFGGTLISIILAVLAIIYGFIQADNQSQSSSIIASQLASLKDVVTQMDKSNIQFSDELSKLESISKQIESVKSDTTKLYEKAFNDANTSSFAATNTTGRDEIDNVLNVNKFMSLLVYCLENFKDELESKDGNEFLRMYFVAPMVKYEIKDKKIEDPTSFDEEMFTMKWISTGMSYIAILNSLGLLKVQGKKVSLTQKFTEKVDVVIPKIKEKFADEINAINGAQE